LAPNHGSSVAPDAGAGKAVSFVFAAACLVEVSGGVVVQRPGHARGLHLVLEGVLEPPSPAVWAGALGRLREGAVQSEGAWLRRLPLDWRSAAGPVRLELLFANSVALQLEAERAWLACDAGFAVFESLAC
jgi:hypothetical protein